MKKSRKCSTFSGFWFDPPPKKKMHFSMHFEPFCLTFSKVYDLKLIGTNLKLNDDFIFIYSKDKIDFVMLLMLKMSRLGCQFLNILGFHWKYALLVVRKRDTLGWNSIENFLADKHFQFFDCLALNAQIQYGWVTFNNRNFCLSIDNKISIWVLLWSSNLGRLPGQTYTLHQDKKR